MRRCEFVPKFLTQSQLIIVVVLQLRWLHETANLGSSVKISLLLGCIFRFFLDLVELRVVPGELLQSN